MLYTEFLQGTGATQGKQSYKAYQEIEQTYMNSDTMTKQEAYALYQKPSRSRKYDIVNGIKIKQFDNMEALENNSSEYKQEQIYIVHNGNYLAADMMTECNSYKTALKRFFKGLENISIFNGWYEGILENCEGGYFEDIDQITEWDENNGKFITKWAGSYHWHVEQHEESWYIELTVNTETISK